MLNLTFDYYLYLHFFVKILINTFKKKALDN